MTEYTVLIESLKQSCGFNATKNILEQFEEVVKKNNLEYTPRCLRDFLRLTELKFSHNQDKRCDTH